MPLYDFECTDCKKITEAIADTEAKHLPCTCGAMAKKIISASGVYTGNADDTSWAKYGMEVMPKDSQHPETREFMRDPTKGNYGKAMKAEGVRFMEPGEKGIDRSKQNPNMPKDAMAKLLQRNRSLEVRG